MNRTAAPGRDIIVRAGCDVAAAGDASAIAERVLRDAGREAAGGAGIGEGWRILRIVDFGARRIGRVMTMTGEDAGFVCEELAPAQGIVQIDAGIKVLLDLDEIDAAASPGIEHEIERGEGKIAAPGGRALQRAEHAVDVAAELDRRLGELGIHVRAELRPSRLRVLRLHGTDLTGATLGALLEHPCLVSLKLPSSAYHGADHSVLEQLPG